MSATSPTIDTTATDARDEHQYSHAEIEGKWRDTWRETSLNRTEDEVPGKPNWYSLTMYPYPSGTLHVGHWYAFAIPDAFARLQRMRGYNVLFPMGFDAFGLPAENAAIRANIHPAIWTYENIENMHRQYDLMGAMIDWSREVITCNPDFYRWNQWLFLRMLEKSLAYRAGGSVWWCPNDQTVLANEQVIDGNICERCGAEVYKRDLEQWYFKITDYAEDLLEGLSEIDWPERVKTMQRNWIGRSEGARLGFQLETGDTLDVFTTRPDTVFGATFMVLAPEHPLVEKITTVDQSDVVNAYVDQAKRQSEVERMITDEGKKKTGVFTGSYAINPVNDERIPVWIADYVLMSYGTGAIMAVPAHDERDFAFAKTFDLPIRVVIQPEDQPDLGDDLADPYVGPGKLVNSGQFDGQPVPAFVPELIAWLDEQGRGKAEINFRLRDWLISRQRYWGTPIPVVYCDACGMVPLPDDQLPVILPLEAEFQPNGRSPLGSHEAFLHTTCPTCGGPATRETDTMDTFVDSSWYWFRYTCPDYEAGMIDPIRNEKWTPVDLYCGGIEHAILHLLYARFITRVLNDMGLVNHVEPIKALRNQGIILSVEGVKMSKSRGTQVGPDDLVATHGADALRLHLMFLGPWEQGGAWSDRGIVGMERFLKRAFLLVSSAGEQPLSGAAPVSDVAALRALIHKTIKRVTDDMDAFQFNTMIAGLIEYVNDLMKLRDQPVASDPIWREAMETLTLLMAPSVPYIAEEMWSRLGNPYSVHQQTWPVYDAALAVEETIELPVQVNGKVRDRLVVASSAAEGEVIAAAKASEKVAEHLAGKQIVREIYVPGRLVNFVVK